MTGTKMIQRNIYWLATLATMTAAIVQADIVVQPTSATAVEANNIINNTIDGSGISDASIIETADPVPTTWPTCTGGDNRTDRWRGSWTGDASETSTGNYATYELGSTYDVKGLYWWGAPMANNRGTEAVTIAVSTDGTNYTDVVVNYDVIDPANTDVVKAGEYIDFGSTHTGVTHVRVDNVQYSGYKGTIQEVRIVAYSYIPPAPPTWLEPVTGVTGVEGMAYNDTLAGKATDPNQDPLTFSLTNVGTWLNVETNGVLSGIPNVLGTNTFTVTADDGNGNGSPVETTLTIFVRTTLPPEWAEPVTSSAARINEPYSATLAGKATDPDGETITYSLTDVGTWLNVATNGVLSGTPTAAGTDTFTVVADDGLDSPTSTTLTIVVKPTPGEQISINFTQAAEQVLVGGETIGPLNSDSTHWNNLTAGNVATDAGTNLVNSAGAITTLDIARTARGTWHNSVDGTANDQRRLSLGYLDDANPTPVTATLTEIPYKNYRVYVLISSDQAQNNVAGFDASNALVTDGSNGGVWVFGGDDQTTRKCFSSVNVTETATGSSWMEATDTVIGNYWVMDNLSGPTLNISIGGNNTPGRASMAGIVIEKIAVQGSQVTDLAIAGNGSGLELTWTGEAGMPYGVETNANLIIDAGWDSWITGRIGAGGTITITNTIDADQIFYRVISE